MPSISRRTLLQGTGAMAVVGSLSGLTANARHLLQATLPGFTNHR